MQAFKIIIEKYADGYVAYPLGMKGVVVGEGDSFEAALSDVKSAIRFHIETFGAEAVESLRTNLSVTAIGLGVTTADR